MTEPRTNRAHAPIHALLIDSLDDEHEVSVVRGALAAMRDGSSTLLCIAGGALGHADPDQASRNFAFDLLRSDGVRGGVVLSSAIGNSIGPVRLVEWLTRFAGIPLCSAGVTLAGYPSVRVDNAAGIREGVRHLVQVHGKRAIGFIRGPAASAEAEERLEAYRAGLRAEGIEPDDRHVVDGDFEKASGVQAVKILFDQRRASVHTLDALFAANDYMAIGALEELLRRGIQVPEQIAVVGFDDVDSARNARPALTTIRQPAEPLGRAAIALLRNLCDGRASDATELLATELVVRRSCGCVATDLASAAGAQFAFTSVGVETAFVQRRQIMTAELARAAHGTLGGAGTAWESRLIEALLSDLRGEGFGRFSSKLRQMLQGVEHSGGDASAAPEVIAALRRQALPCVTGDPVARDRLEEALHDGQLVAASLVAEVAVARIQRSSTRFRSFARRVHAAMFRDPGQLSQVLAETLPSFGIEACLVAELSAANDPLGDGRILCGFGPSGQRATNERCVLRALGVHPMLENTSRSFFLLPIALGGKPTGILLLSTATIDGRMLEDLRDLFGTVLGLSTLG
ncbi:MAG TPA: substrate-binding domain-containing protein [Polyangiaceae bacterium]